MCLTDSHNCNMGMCSDQTFSKVLGIQIENTVSVPYNPQQYTIIVWNVVGTRMREATHIMPRQLADMRSGQLKFLLDTRVELLLDASVEPTKLAKFSEKTWGRYLLRLDPVCLACLDRALERQVCLCLGWNKEVGTVR